MITKQSIISIKGENKAKLIAIFSPSGPKKQAVVEVKRGCGLSIHNLLQLPLTVFLFVYFLKKEFFSKAIFTMFPLCCGWKAKHLSGIFKKRFLSLKEGKEEMNSDRAIEMNTKFSTLISFVSKKGNLFLMHLKISHCMHFWVSRRSVMWHFFSLP